MSIQLLEDLDSAPYNLLEEADPSRHMVEGYLKSGKCYLGYLGDELVAVMVLLPLREGLIEIKNLAVVEAYRGRGFGQEMIVFAEGKAKAEKISRMRIGTANSSIKQLGLYQRLGYELTGVKFNFFVDHYSQPIEEGGIPTKHLLVLEKALK